MRCHRVPHKLELLVNVDNPDEHAKWVNLTEHSKGFIVPVFSDNIHEIRGYNRLAGMARGEVIVLVQDDRVGPKSCTFYEDLVAVFERWPQLGGVGMNAGLFSGNGPNNELRHARNAHDFKFKDGVSNIVFQFISLADFGPYAFRRTAYIDIGGLDEGMSEAGQCGIQSDFDVSMRLWAAEYLVGHIYLPPLHLFEGDDSGAGGTHKGKMFAQCWVRNLIHGQQHFWRRFSQDAFEIVEQKVNASNHELLVPFQMMNSTKV